MRHAEPCTLVCDRLTTVIGAETIKPFTQRLTMKSIPLDQLHGAEDIAYAIGQRMERAA